MKGPSHAEGKSPHLGEHYDSLPQQFSAAKLGMWLFLATELLLFGGLFCIYAVYRANHPELFEYGSRYLDTTWGALNTIVLILSSFTVAMAVRAAQCNRQRELRLFLTLTLVCAFDFLGVKYIEYSHKFSENLVWGPKFYQDPHPEEVLAVAPDLPPGTEIKPGDPTKGRELFLATCASCHGRSGQGMPKLGPDLRGNVFVADRDDRDLLVFLIRGRPRNDPENSTGLVMPARGGNPFLTDGDLLDIIASLRTLPKPGEEDESPIVESPAGEPREKSVIPRAPTGPAGMVERPDARLDTKETSEPDKHVDPRHDPHRPANLHMFFAIYFCMTGLHGLHVVAGIVVIGWLRIRAAKGHFSSAYFTPVDLGALYWHLVDIIWIFLFPLLYLIK